MTNNIDLHSIEQELMYINIRVRRLCRMEWESSLKYDMYLTRMIYDVI